MQIIVLFSAVTVLNNEITGSDVIYDCANLHEEEIRFVPENVFFSGINFEPVKILK